MLRVGGRTVGKAVFQRHTGLVRHASSSSPHHHPNAPLELDPAFQTLLRDVEISLLNKMPQGAHGLHQPRELEVFPHDPDLAAGYLTSAELDARDDNIGHKETRKSPAAAFGSQRIGAVVLPLDLQSAIARVVADSDKPTLHHDAKRLFSSETAAGEEWNSTYDMHYRSGKEAGRHALRDATAFATVALPSHYSAIYAVFEQLKHRLGPDWQVERVIDWGAATGSGLWASAHAFQRPSDMSGRGSQEMEDIQISHTSLASYLGIDKREGLVRIGKRLVRSVDGVNVSWQKSFHEDNAVDPVDGSNVVALSAFLLSSLPTHIDRKVLVKELWESGAEVIVLIDHDFENIAEAREQLLKLGRKELEDPKLSDSTIRGSHVVAPCPHDGACPLYHPGYGKLQCSFSQRMQRPEFIRRTKHSGAGHENMDYSYVVIRRGPRPTHITDKVGRVGGVGMREFAKQIEDSTPMAHLSLDVDHQELTEQADRERASSHELELSDATEDDYGLIPAEVTSALRQEAYGWPRLVFPPIKRSGHIILDVCHPEGQIMRMTIPKSQGKQPFYDARKSNWGDIFPHDPKNPPQVRHQPERPGHTPPQGQDIGKRRQFKNNSKKASYGKLSEDIKQRRRDQRRARRLAEERDDM